MKYSTPFSFINIGQRCRKIYLNILGIRIIPGLKSCSLVLGPNSHLAIHSLKGCSPFNCEREGGSTSADKSIVSSV